MNVSAKKGMRALAPAAILLALCASLAGCGGTPQQAGGEAGKAGDTAQAAASDAPFSCDAVVVADGLVVPGFGQPCQPAMRAMPHR